MSAGIDPHVYAGIAAEQQTAAKISSQNTDICDLEHLRKRRCAATDAAEKFRMPAAY